jgi:hypothetical protein
MANEHARILVLRDQNGTHYGIPREALEQWCIPAPLSETLATESADAPAVVGWTEPGATFQLSPSAQTWSADAPAIRGEPTVQGTPVLSLTTES